LDQRIKRVVAADACHQLELRVLVYRPADLDPHPAVRADHPNADCHVFSQAA
jgi:hypothetical protein